MAGWAGWERELLGALGLSPTRARLDFLAAWQACEGGSARFNPLNTTQPVPGATSYNSAGVRNYPDRFAGVAALLLTLRLDYYRELRDALRAEHLDAPAIAARSTNSIHTWGTDPTCIARRLRVRPAKR